MPWSVRAGGQVLVELGETTPVGGPCCGVEAPVLDQPMAVVPISVGWRLTRCRICCSLHRDRRFFGTICAIVIAIVVLQVFLTGETRVGQVAAAMLYALVGLAVILLLFGVARTAVQPMQERPSHGRSNQRWRFAWRGSGKSPGW